MELPEPTWRCFETLSSDAEALLISKCCLFSLATLEVGLDPASRSYALIEREGPDSWRWALIDDQGSVIEEGRASSQSDAKRISAVTLWAGLGENDAPLPRKSLSAVDLGHPAPQAATQ